MAEKLIITISSIFLLYIVVANLLYLRKYDNKLEKNMKEFDKRDKVVTRTGGLENDRLNERQ
jgi:hypothetical protein